MHATTVFCPFWLSHLAYFHQYFEYGIHAYISRLIDSEYSAVHRTEEDILLKTQFKLVRSLLCFCNMLLVQMGAADYGWL